MSEAEFKVIGLSSPPFDAESLKAKIRDYVGERIQLSLVSVTVKKTEGSPCLIYLLFVPQRPENGRPPLHFLKDAPGQIFRKDDVYYRVGDECVEAKGPKLFALTQPRPNPYLSAKSPWSFENLVTKRIQNNLPDRNFICPRFIGRDDCLDLLWKWLGDDLAHVKMLAGEGGLGKTSIAYEFADRVSQTPNIPFEQIIWLTAKQKQFVGREDAYVLVPETHYSSYEELLKAIFERLPIILDKAELAEMPVDELRRQIREGLAAYPSFIVVDDIDSLDGEQQKRVAELGFLLGLVKSKLLLTTRHNLAYSQDSAISVGGFCEEEFSDFLGTLQTRNILRRELSSQERRKLFEVTGGSPLYAESVCRLLKFQSFGEAVKGWGNDAGVRVRAAALDKEILMLSPEAKRVLLTTAFLSEASSPEIVEITDYPQEVVLRSVQELSSLFLIAGETLAEQPRFSVPDNTAKAVIERAPQLVVDHRRLKGRVDAARAANKGGATDKRVALAIAQAQSLLRLGDTQGAMDTVDDARRRMKSNPDLLGFRAEVLMKFSPPKFEDARRNARDSYQKNCRRSAMFFSWFEAEWLAGHFVGAEEVARAAIENKISGASDWWVKVAAALVSSAEDQKAGSSVDRKIAIFIEASDALNKAIKSVRHVEAKQWMGIQYDVHDRIWHLVSSRLSSIDGIDVAVDALEKIWRTGDYRFTNAKRALFVAEAICIYLDSPLNRGSSPAVVAAELRLGRCRKLIERRKNEYTSDTRNPLIESELERINEKHLRISAKRKDGG